MPVATLLVQEDDAGGLSVQLTVPPNAKPELTLAMAYDALDYISSVTGPGDGGGETGGSGDDAQVKTGDAKDTPPKTKDGETLQ